MSSRLLIALWCVACAAAAPGPLRFRVTLAREASTAPVSGRLLVFMSDDATPRERLASGFIPGAAWVAAREIESLAPGETVEFDPDVEAYPRPFSEAPAASYQFMALLDRNHDYVLRGQGQGDLYGPVVRVERLDPANADPVPLALNLVDKERPFDPDGAGVRLVEYQSALLTRYWGHPIRMRAIVVLPPGYEKTPARRYPTLYVHHGFGGDRRQSLAHAARMRRLMSQGKIMPSVLVYPEGSFATGDHEFADSVNNGPWGRALIEEFIPYLERTYRLEAKPSARFLTGHSSGGWASLWLQVTYPDFFGGTWSTSPDPVDFRSFCGVNAAPGSGDNAYRTASGAPRNLVREGGKDVVSWEQFARHEEVLGEYGGQMASFEWVFSPRGEDGRPMRMFNRVTGVLDQDVLRAWQKYDIRLTLDREWNAKAPRLAGKLHIVCGEQDTFHLEEAVRMLCGFLKQKGSDAVCELVPGRDHMNLYDPYRTYPGGLELRIAREMQTAFQAANR
ncbi:MAG TPA: alpha/beta hydrolase-fold protein [Bryobacteraceae bacterium]